MQVRYLGQLILFVAISLVVLNLLINAFGKWTVLGWFEGMSPLDLMFGITLAMIVLLIVGGEGGNGGGGTSGPQPPFTGQSTKTIW